MKTRILIVDDHDVVRRGVVAMLSDRPELEVCGEARSGRDAIAVAASMKPDLVIMDLRMPDMNGLDATRQILKENPQIEVLILTMLDSEQLVRQVFASGARGYLLKSDAGNELLAAVDTVRQHKPFFTSSIAETMLRHFLDTGSAEAADAAGVDGLTAREREIVQLVAEGKSSKEISVILNISQKTVETHRSHIMNKLELHSVPDLVRYAIRNHIIEC